MTLFSTTAVLLGLTRGEVTRQGRDDEAQTSPGKILVAHTQGCGDAAAGRPQGAPMAGQLQNHQPPRGQWEGVREDPTQAAPASELPGSHVNRHRSLHLRKEQSRGAMEQERACP